MEQLNRKILDRLPASKHNNKIIYFDITDHINSHAYRLTDIPDIAALRSTYELSPLTGGPVKPPFGYEVSSGRFSINWMINSYASQIPFTFSDYKECIEAAEKLQQYIDSLKDRGQHSEEDKAYLLRAETFNVQLQKIARKMIMFYRVDVKDFGILTNTKKKRLMENLTSESKLQKSNPNTPITRPRNPNNKRTGKFNFLTGNPK